MSLILNTNIGSLTAQNNLSGSQASLSTSLQRLSSGLRINSASDDAAGLAISQQFTTQINGTNQAVRNANDAVSEAQTTAGALTTIVNNLQSIRTLAVEAANGSNSAAGSSRRSISKVQQQIAEITQIAQQTTFNGVERVERFTSGTTTYQVGANVGNTISINLAHGRRRQPDRTDCDRHRHVAGRGCGAARWPLTGATNDTDRSGRQRQSGERRFERELTPQQWPGRTCTSSYAKAAAINAAGAFRPDCVGNHHGGRRRLPRRDQRRSARGYLQRLSINGVAIFGGVKRCRSRHHRVGDAPIANQSVLHAGWRRHGRTERRYVDFDGGRRQQHQGCAELRRRQRQAVSRLRAQRRRHHVSRPLSR